MDGLELFFKANIKSNLWKPFSIFAKTIIDCAFHFRTIDKFDKPGWEYKMYLYNLSISRSGINYICYLCNYNYLNIKLSCRFQTLNCQLC